MLYLLETENYYKIGYAKNIDLRMNQYKTHNPEYKLLDYCEGDMQLELICHKLLQSKIPYKNEWYYKDSLVFQVWRYVKDINENTEIRIPTDMKDLHPQQLLIYASLEIYKNEPLSKIAKLLDISMPSLRKHIKILTDNEYIKVTKNGNKLLYDFTPLNEYIIIPKEIISSKELTFLEKAYMIAIYLYMTFNADGYFPFTHRDLAKELHELLSKINIPVKSKNLKINYRVNINELLKTILVLTKVIDSLIRQINENTEANLDNN